MKTPKLQAMTRQQLSVQLGISTKTLQRDCGRWKREILILDSEFERGCLLKPVVINLIWNKYYGENYNSCLGEQE